MTRRIVSLTVLLAVFALAGCGEVPGPVVDTACKWVKPILVSRDDQLTSGTAIEILAHNDKWRRNCPGETGAR
jgi:hypothetical protein